MKKYTLFYVLDSSPLKKEFRSKKSLGRFIESFVCDPYNGYWLDFWVAGKVNYLDG